MKGQWRTDDKKDWRIREKSAERNEKWEKRSKERRRKEKKHGGRKRRTLTLTIVSCPPFSFPSLIQIRLTRSPASPSPPPARPRCHRRWRLVWPGSRGPSASDLCPLGRPCPSGSAWSSPSLIELTGRKHEDVKKKTKQIGALRLLSLSLSLSSSHSDSEPSSISSSSSLSSPSLSSSFSIFCLTLVKTDWSTMESS